LFGFVPDDLEDGSVLDRLIRNSLFLQDALEGEAFGAGGVVDLIAFEFGPFEGEGDHVGGTEVVDLVRVVDGGVHIFFKKSYEDPDNKFHGGYAVVQKDHFELGHQGVVGMDVRLIGFQG